MRPLIFYFLSFVVLGSAFMVVVKRNIFHSALFLILSFFGVAALFITLDAEFLAAVQVLVYVGAISVLIILAIMLTRDVHKGSPGNKFRVPAFIVAALFLGGVIYAMVNTGWAVSSTPPLEPTTPTIANLLFSEGGFILPLEIAPLLLVAAIIGAIVLVREK